MRNKENTKKRSKVKIGLSIAFAITIISVAVYFYFNFDFSSETTNNSSEISSINGDAVQVNADGNITVINNTTIRNYYSDPDATVSKDDDSADEDSEVGFTTETYVRLADDEDRTWYKTVQAQVGDKVEFRIGYENTSDETQSNVAIRDVLFSNNLRYVDGSTVLKNSNHPNGAYILNDALVENGIRIGSYGSNSNALLYFTAEVVDEDLSPGTNILSNWGQAGVGETTIQDHADVIVNLPKK